MRGFLSGIIIFPRLTLRRELPFRREEGKYLDGAIPMPTAFSTMRGAKQTAFYAYQCVPAIQSAFDAN